MSGTVLVTGASGFAGSHLLESLSREGRTVVAWHRPGSSVHQATRCVDWQAVDLLQPDAVRSAIAQSCPEAVYHCAGAAHVGRSWGTTESTLAINVRGTHHLLEALRRENINAAVLIPSSAMVYAASSAPLREDDPLLPSSPYALSKLAQELVARGGVGYSHPSIARAFNHFGPGQDPLFVASGFARRIADIEAGRWQPTLAVGNLDARRDFTDVRDTIRAYRLILERGRPGKVYNVCSGRGITIRELLERMLSRARVEIRVEVDPARLRPNDVPVLVGDCERIRRELGWEPMYSLDSTIDDLLDHWRLKG